MGYNGSMNYWFRPKRVLGWFAFYVPTSLGGWIVTLVLLALAVKCFLLVDAHSHSGSDTLLNFAPWAISLMLIFDLLSSGRFYQLRLFELFGEGL